MIYFHNPGEIDIRGATVAGLSVKDNASPIGYFGTGLKYAIACILRFDGRITIHSGTEAYHFSSSRLDFRGEAFEQIYMNDIPLGFTTEYGKNWKAWQVFRELYANALDEGGSVTDRPMSPQHGTTLVEVGCEALLEPYQLRDEIILPRNLAYDWQSDNIAILDRPSDSIFYRGVRVADFSSNLTYNILDDTQLTEDRTLPSIYSAFSAIGKSAQSCTDKELCYKIVRGRRGLEKELTFSHFIETSREFLDEAEAAFKANPVAYSKLKSLLGKHRPKSVEPQPVELTQLQTAMLDKAKRLVERMNMSCDIPIVVADIGDSLLGKLEDGKVYLSPEVFRQGTKQVLSTLYEELTHHHTDKDDLTYNMQTYLFNTIVSLYEEHVFKEPI